MGKLNFELPPEVADKYEVINTVSPILHSRIGDIDFRRISLDQAEALVKSGSKYFRAKKQPKTKKVTS